MSDYETQRHQEALAIEAKDDEQIMEELKGRIVEEYFYEFKLETKLGERVVTGISWAGIKQLARVQGNVRVSRPEVSETDEHFRVVCSAEDPSRNIVMWGAAQQPKKMKLKDGPEIEDNFALTKCLSKAQRNAIRALFPETIIKHAYEMWKAKKALPAQPQPVKEVPIGEQVGPIKPGERGATREELDEVLDEEFKAGTLQLIGKEDQFQVIIINPLESKKHREIGQILAHYGGKYTPEGQKLFWTVPKAKAPSPAEGAS